MKNVLLVMVILTGALAVGCWSIEQPNTAISYEYGALLKLNDSAAYRQNLDWHRKGRKNEVRISWFLDNRPRVAMLCSTEWQQTGQPGKVMKSREVYGWLNSDPEQITIIPSKAEEVRTICKQPPLSIPARQFEKILIVSVSGEDDRAFYVYDRRDLPREIVRLCEIPDAYVEAGQKAFLWGPRRHGNANS